MAKALLFLFASRTKRKDAVENLQREDIHPLEEANGFRSLLDATKYTITEIAAKCGKSEAYVVNRIKLTELIPPMAEAFLADKITIGHALLIAKLPAAHQQEAFNASFRQMWTSEGNTQVLIPVRELAAWIQSNILLELAAAPFDKNDAALVPQAGNCTECPKRTEGCSRSALPLVNNLRCRACCLRAVLLGPLGPDSRHSASSSAYAL